MLVGVYENHRGKEAMDYHCVWRFGKLLTIMLMDAEYRLHSDKDFRCITRANLGWIVGGRRNVAGIYFAHDVEVVFAFVDSQVLAI